jgi:putative phosphoribosyl transferase
LSDHDRKDKIRIISYRREPFHDRMEAGQLLAQELGGLASENAVVLGIPRGGLIVARALAKGIGADLDIVLSRKLGAPGHSELAIGALAENGEVFLNQYVVEELAVPDTYIEQEKQRQVMEIQRRRRLIRAVLDKVPLVKRFVIITDDGIATGATMQAAVWAVRREEPGKLVVAVPVASDEAVARIAQEVDELVCLRMPAFFQAVGQFYIQFDQTTDEEVLEILKQEKERKNKISSKQEK